MSTEILRPNANGDEINFTCFPNAGEANWENVDEASADDSTTFNFVLATPTGIRELYNLQAHSGSGAINSITIYYRLFSAYAEGTAKLCLKHEGTVYENATTDTVVVDAPYWYTFNKTYTVEPLYSQAWEWSDIDALQIGVRLSNASSQGMRVTQIYLSVDYVSVSTHPLLLCGVGD
jgi:hypothetical protein